MAGTVIDIPERLFTVAESAPFSGEFDLPELDAKPDRYRFAEPLRYNVTVSNTGEALLVMGTVEGTGSTLCARCQDEFDLDVNGEVEGYFLLPDAPVPESLEEDEYDRLGPENKIDLAPLLEAAVRMDLPLVPLCRPDCKGICPDCGQNLNEGSCDCAEKRAAADAAEAEAENPFAVLKNIDFGN